MRVFVLGTGRCGTVALYHASKHITNFTAGHESRAPFFGKDRLDYPDQHLECDNRLSWHLGTLQKNFGDRAFYVHLLRDRDKVAHSYARRYFQPKSIIDAYTEGIHKAPPFFMTAEERLKASYSYVDTITDNIELFLKDKPYQLTMHLENIQEDFPILWEKINAQGDIESALKEFSTPHNPSSKRKWKLVQRLKFTMAREWKHFTLSLKSS